MSASRREIHALLDQLEGPLARRFLESVDQIKSQGRVDRLANAIRNGDIEGGFRAAGFRPGSWAALIEQIRQAYIESGIFTMSADVPRRLGMQFDWTNPRAESWIVQHSSDLITRITEEQTESIRMILAFGVAQGRNPRNVALDIIGRVDPRTRRRAGGIIGLNGPQAEAVINARRDLEALSSNYFNRKRRDRRFDGLVRRAIESGEPLNDADINRIVGRYADRLLELRGTTIARTEALQTMNEAADESLRQVVDEGLATPEGIRRVWDATGDARTRPDHAQMDGDVEGLNDAFTSGSGARLMHPGDMSLGAGAGDIINCRCVVRHEIDFIEQELAA